MIFYYHQILSVDQNGMSNDIITGESRPAIGRQISEFVLHSDDR
jgi:hypothetical protein